MKSNNVQGLGGQEPKGPHPLLKPLITLRAQLPATDNAMQTTQQ
jgi:hypothetical protein